MNMKKVAILFVGMILLLACSSFAAEQDFHQMSNGYSSVSVGDTVLNLLEEFGEPAYKEEHDEYQFRDGPRSVTRKNVHLWFYPDTNKPSWMYRILIISGRITKITKIYD